MPSNRQIVRKIMPLCGLFFCTSCLATSDWFIRPYVGLNYMADFNASSENISGPVADTHINLDPGYQIGLGIGYQYTNQFAIEAAWEYKSNDSEVAIENLARFEEGNYASNQLLLNGFYFPKTRHVWLPYIGAGLSWAQEIDIDLERSNFSRSFSSDSEFGYQLFAGVNYPLTTHLHAQFELRYSSFGNFNLEGEHDNSDKLTDIENEATSAQFGIVYYF